MTELRTQAGDVVDGAKTDIDRKTGRLGSLDALRGLTVLGMILVNSTAGVRKMDGPVFPLLLHAQWTGFTIADTVFPAFILMIGVSIAISFRPGRPVDWRSVMGRSVRLILLGLFLTNMFILWDWDKIWPPRMAGVLQRIGIVYAVVALLYPRMSARSRGIAAAAILLLYWPLCLLPQPDGLSTDLWVQGHNFVSWADRALFGNWRFVKGPDGYDPEGALSTLPTIAEALIGTVAGDMLKRGIGAKKLALAALAMMAGGLLWGLVFPIAKNLWTSSFVLLSAGLALLLLSAFHAFLDGAGAVPRRGGLLGSFGRNAVGAYAFHEVAAFLLLADAVQAPFHWLKPVVGTELAALAPVLIFIAMVWWPISAMDRRGWYLKI
jgi:predicted acyltransferase